MSLRPFTQVPGGLMLSVRLTPRSSRDALEGTGVASDGSCHIKARVRAVPEDGKANAALIALLARKLGLAKAAIILASGATSRQKRLRIEGNAGELAARLDALLRQNEG